MLCFFRKDYAIGLVIRCAISNLGSSIGIVDVGFELWKFLGEPFWISVGQVAIGETAVMIVSYIVYMILRNKQGFYTLIRAKQSIAFKW